MGGCTGAKQVPQKKQQIKNQRTEVNPQKPEVKKEIKNPIAVQPNNAEHEKLAEKDISLVNQNKSNMVRDLKNPLKSIVSGIRDKEVGMGSSKIIKEQPQLKQDSIKGLNVSSKLKGKGEEQILFSEVKPFKSEKQIPKPKEQKEIQNSKIGKQSDSQIRRNPYTYTPPPSDLKDSFEQMLREEPGIKKSGIEEMSKLREKSQIKKVEVKGSSMKKEEKRNEEVGKEETVGMDEKEVVKEEKKNILVGKGVNKSAQIGEDNKKVETVDVGVQMSIFRSVDKNLPVALPENSTRVFEKIQIKQELVYDENPQQLPRLQLAVYKSKMGISFIK